MELQIAATAGQPEVSLDLSPEGYGIRKALLTIDDTMEIISAGRTGIYKLINDGELELVKIGKSSRITALSIAGLLNRRRTEAAAAKKTP